MRFGYFFYKQQVSELSVKQRVKGLNLRDNLVDLPHQLSYQRKNSSSEAQLYNSSIVVKERKKRR